MKKDEFMRPFKGASNSYSTFTVLNTSINDVIVVLNKINPNMVACGGEEDKNGNVRFYAFKEFPTLIHQITKELRTVGYADINWDFNEFVASKNGEPYDGFSAKWSDGSPFCMSDDDEWAAFIEITDNKTGYVFHSGAGSVCTEVKQYYESIVRKHRKFQKSIPEIIDYLEDWIKSLSEMDDDLDAEAAYVLERCLVLFKKEDAE